MAKEHPIHQALRNFLTDNKFVLVPGDYQAYERGIRRRISIPKHYGEGLVYLYINEAYHHFSVVEILEQKNPLLNYFITHS